MGPPPPNHRNSRTAEVHEPPKSKHGRSNDAREAPRLRRGAKRGGLGGPARGPPSQSIEHQNCTRDLAGLHGAERLVDVLQAAPASDHLVELEAALAVELDVTGHVDL